VQALDACAYLKKLSKLSSLFSEPISSFENIKTSQFSKQSSEVYKLLKRIKNSGSTETIDDHLNSNQSSTSNSCSELSISRCTDYSENLETYRTTENLTNSTIALDNSSQNYCSNFNDSTANSVNGITDNILKQSPPIIDQQQVINIFRNGNQGYKKYITKKNYDTVRDTIGLANHLRLFAITREFQEQNSNLLSQNKVKNKKTEERNRALETENTNLRVNNKEVEEKNQNTNLKVNNKEVKKRNHILGKDITKLKVKNKETEEWNHALETENTNLKVYNKETEKRNHAIETDNTNLKKITKLEIKLGDISKKYSDLLTEHLNLEVIYAALQDSYKALQAKDGNNEEEIKNLKKELKETREEKDK
ncbi:17164_t:CDS:2, partial [Gigaspora rosea]